MAAYAGFTKDIQDRGLMEAGEALEQTRTATTVRVKDGQTLVTDGPFAETKEALGGFYLVKCKDLVIFENLAGRNFSFDDLAEDAGGVERGSHRIRKGGLPSENLSQPRMQR